MQAGDGMPELMCVPCVLQVSRAFTFKQQCQRSEQTLKLFLEQNHKCNDSNICNNENAIDDNVTHNAEQCAIKHEHVIIGNDIIETTNVEHSFLSTDNTTTDNNHLNNELVLDSLPPEIESGSFEEEIELSNLSSPATSDNIDQQHLDENVLNEEEQDDQPNEIHETSKFGDYFDDMKLAALTNTEISNQSIVETFGK